MKTFRVWIQPDDYGYLMLVDGEVNASWLLDQLGRSFVFRSARPIAHAMNSTLCTFQIPRTALLPLKKLQKLLTDMPEVTLLRVAGPA